MKTIEVIELSKHKKVRDLTFLNLFWGTNFSDKEKEKLKLFIKSHGLRNKKLSVNDISKKINISKSTITKWFRGESIPYIAHYLRYYNKLKPNKKIVSINSTRGGLLIGPWIRVSDKINKYSDIIEVLSQLNKKNIEKEFGYILGIMVGDASKHGIKRKNKVARRIQLRLSTKFKTNLNFGGYVSHCLESLGIRINKTKNCPAGKRNPNDFYSWHSQCSPLIDWMFKVCLGLKNTELTSYDKVKSSWIQNSPKHFRISFLQGVADSDGYIDITQYRAGIVTKPNAKFIQRVFDSLGIHSNIGNLHNKTMQQVKIRLEDAYSLPLFNPIVYSYRYQLMEEIINAEKLPHHWPEWLGNKVNNYLDQELSSTKIIKRILDKHNIIIRQSGIKKRKDKLKMEKENRIILGIESTALD
jgi:transcriptional regulator with XRE-family HTH domain